MGWVRGRAGGSGRSGTGARIVTRRVAERGLWRHLRRATALLLAPVTAAATSLVPVAFTVAAAVGVSAVAAAVASASARASTESVLVLLQNGETTAPETAIAQAAGFTVTQVTPTTWRGMTASQFAAYSALVIGDPSSGTTCSSLTPTTGTSGSDALSTTWQSAVSGKMAVLGTAPALAGSTGIEQVNLATGAVTYLVTDSLGSILVIAPLLQHNTSMIVNMPMTCGPEAGRLSIPPEALQRSR